MFLDASAIIAIIAREADADALGVRLGQASEVFVSAIAIYEAVLGLARIGGISIGEARGTVDRFLGELRAQIQSVDAAIGRAALTAFERYGRGRHPAALNMGDCFAYASTRELGVPLLCKGNDFPQTDVTLA